MRFTHAARGAALQTGLIRTWKRTCLASSHAGSSFRSARSVTATAAQVMTLARASPSAPALPPCAYSSPPGLVCLVRLGHPSPCSTAPMGENAGAGAWAPKADGLPRRGGSSDNALRALQPGAAPSGRGLKFPSLSSNELQQLWKEQSSNGALRAAAGRSGAGRSGATQGAACQPPGSPLPTLLGGKYALPCGGRIQDARRNSVSATAGARRARQGAAACVACGSAVRMDAWARSPAHLLGRVHRTFPLLRMGRQTRTCPARRS